MKIGVPVESSTGERRVALVPAVVPALEKLGLQVVVQSGAGQKAGFPDGDYEEKGCPLVATREEIVTAADCIVQVRLSEDDIPELRSGQIIIGLFNPLGEPATMKRLAEQGATVFALELVPRITRAQSMDALTSMASIAGYKAVLLAAGELDKLFPLMMTAAGTITPARVFVLGAGVAGLQAIATAKRLGAVVQAYDVRPAVKEQVESLGAKFFEIPISAEEAETKGGYAKAMDEEFYRRQREAMTRALAESDVVITTAAVPGKKAPILITEDMVKVMRSGSVIVDLAAETGGNCELTRAGETHDVNGVVIMGPAQLPSTVPRDASQMYARNIAALLQTIVKDGQFHFDTDDEVVRETMVAHDGKVIHPRVLELLGQTESTTE